MAKIVTVYTKTLRASDSRAGQLVPVDMSYIRWFKISESLARLGHKVDMATGEFKWWSKQAPIQMSQNLRRILLSQVKWSDYDVVKTFFFLGFQTLEDYGGADHPFIISKLGSVVAHEDREGIFFYGRTRQRFYSIQEKINRSSRIVSLLTEPARRLWYEYFGAKENVIIVPTGVDRVIPAPSKDPYPGPKRARCIFMGNVYTKDSQPQANALIIEKLNRLGRLLARFDIGLYLLGPGDVRALDEKSVTYLGVAPYEQSWDYLYFANAGIVMMGGPFSHNNESSKIYHYLRAGLPVIAESGFPNENIINESALGFIVENGNLQLMAEKIKEAVERDWNRQYAIDYILNNYTWDKRAEIYDRIIRKVFN